MGGARADTGPEAGLRGIRRHDLDWLRVVLFSILVVHHSLVGFAPFGAEIYGIANDTDGGPLVALVVYWTHGWRLPTLFLIAGIATWFATAGGTAVPRLERRLARLLLPLAAGTLTLTPLAAAGVAWGTGRLGRPGVVDALFWPPRVMHLWFLWNLAIYTLLFWPLLSMRARLEGIPLGPRGIVALAALAATLVAIATKPWGGAIAGDGYQLLWYAAIYAGGILIGAHGEAVLGWAARAWRWLALGGLLLFAAEVAVIETVRAGSDALADAYAEGGWAARGLAPAYGSLTLAMSAAEGLAAWAWALAALGLAGRYLTRGGPVLRALSPAVFPVYVLHFPVTLWGIALAAQLALPWPLEFLALTLATFALSWAGYLVLSRMGRVGWLFGCRWRPRDALRLGSAP